MYAARILASACLLLIGTLTATPPTHAQTLSEKETLIDAPSPQIANVDIRHEYLPAPIYFRENYTLTLTNDDSPIARKHTKAWLRFFEENKTRKELGAAAVIGTARFTYKEVLKLGPHGH
jgi:hypothetical protein